MDLIQEPVGIFYIIIVVIVHVPGLLQAYVTSPVSSNLWFSGGHIEAPGLMNRP